MLATIPSKPQNKRLRWLLAAILLAGAVWSIMGLEVTLARLLNAPSDAWNILHRMIPPAFGEVHQRGVVEKVFESVYIAWIGTVIGAVVSLPLAFLAAMNVSPRWIRVPIRQIFNVVRAVPELIMAVIFIPITGLGPWAGGLAIGIHSVGTLGKWAYEAIEDSDDGPVEAVESCGGAWISEMRWGVLPQVMPTITSYWLFRFEINVRASAVLGMIGAGGVGSELVSQLQFRNFPEVGAVLIITIAMVLTVDTLSGMVRRRIISGSEPTKDRNQEAVIDLTGIRTR
tara:strand:+ start:1413 stop:2267 length:855 start_codon:yes stop_codon:yes gene_type:complete